MEQKTLIWIGLAVGSFIGSCIPLIWGAGMLSLWSVIFTAIGGIAGVYAGFKLGE